jgi:hypothetical protein
VIFREHTYATEAHVLIAGIARTTCLNADKERVTAGFIAPGLIPELPSLSTSRFDFCWEAYNNCRVGTLDWNGFGGVTLNGRKRHSPDSTIVALNTGTVYSGGPLLFWTVLHCRGKSLGSGAAGLSGRLTEEFSPRCDSLAEATV